MKVKRLMVVDLSNFIFRAFYAIRPLNAPDGTPVNALYGVFNMLQKMVTVYKPSHLIIAKDSGRDTFRKELYPEYKANRLETPEDLAPQFALIDQLIEAMEMPTLVMPKYEADDVIGSIVTQWKKNCEEVLIASSDKDLMQFVGGHVSMLDAVKGKILATDDVCDKMGVRPDQIVDYLSMVGDSSDNIPGMRGIGAKGAAKLLAEHQTLENCIAASGEFGNKRVKNAFENHLDDAYLSKKLITIVTNLELALGLEDTSFNLQVTPALLELLKGWGFNSAIRKLEGQKNAASSGAKNEPLPSSAVESVATTDQSDVVDPLPSRPSAKFFRIDNQESWQQLLLKIKQCESITVDLSCSPLVLAISLDGSVAHLIDQECGELINQSLKDIFRLNSIKVVCWNAKEIYRYMLSSLPQLQLPTTLIDLMGAAYLCDPSGKNSLADSLERYINISFPSIKLDKLSPDELRQLKADQVVLIHQLHGPLTIRLDELNLITLFSTVELEVTRILSKMEHVGICLNLPLFDQLEQQLEDQLAGIEFEMVTQISACNIEGSDQINLRSSKQLGELLFNQLGFPVIKKNKSGPSTDSEVMRELMLQVDSPIPGLILKFRELDKLLSTYIRTMPKLLDHKTNRLHCHFNQFLAATGRLSSERPNLQNIPVRKESGRRIRQGFIAAPGKVLLSADYSQIELRL
ncbi:MAG: hypothetical protein HN623_01905, partial [Bdellovibrionales bacterium]|nr:hypothetical protein [Bdellovibrionales bacterium]